jgi:hypothetical protein
VRPEPGPRYFLTVDAETPVIVEGVRALAAIRTEVQRETGIPIPFTWFVRFQRRWDDYNHPVLPASEDWFDGFELLGPLVHELSSQGDEIGWHYHAYHYVAHRDMPHADRIAVLQADLARCAKAMRERHPRLEVAAFRFGWFFVPDHCLYRTLNALGLTVDASARPDRDGHSVSNFGIPHTPAVVRQPGIVDGVLCVPYERTWNWHDWSLVAHDLSWHRMSNQEAARAQEEFRHALRRIVAKARARDGRFTTYADFRASRNW